MSWQTFFHTLNIMNLTKPPPVDEIYVPDNTPTEIANGRLDQINRNANEDHNDGLLKLLDTSRREARQNHHAALSLAADRTALYKTIGFIEKQLAAGKDPKQVMERAQGVRKQEFLKASTDRAMNQRFKNGIHTLPASSMEVMKLLVDDLPVGQGPNRRKPTGPRPGHHPSR